MCVWRGDVGWVQLNFLRALRSNKADVRHRREWDAFPIIFCEENNRGEEGGVGARGLGTRKIDECLHTKQGRGGLERPHFPAEGGEVG
jgi:hypothetical protein